MAASPICVTPHITTTLAFQAAKIWPKISLKPPTHDDHNRDHPVSHGKQQLLNHHNHDHSQQQTQPTAIMPPAFETQSYWHTRFTTESHFEWLLPSTALLPILTSLPSGLSTPILHLGFGTSSLQLHLRAAGFTDITNVDYEPLAVERGKEAEMKEFGDVKMGYQVVDVTEMEMGREYGLVVDKGAADAVACGGEEGVRKMVERVGESLGEGGVWVCVSYSGGRFEWLVSTLIWWGWVFADFECRRRMGGSGRWGC